MLPAATEPLQQVLCIRILFSFSEYKSHGLYSTLPNHGVISHQNSPRVPTPTPELFTDLLAALGHRTLLSYSSTVASPSGALQSYRTRLLRFNPSSTRPDPSFVTVSNELLHELMSRALFEEKRMRPTAHRQYPFLHRYQHPQAHPPSHLDQPAPIIPRYQRLC